LRVVASPGDSRHPAGHALQAWLDAFNSGDRGRIEAMIAKYKPPLPLDATMNFRNQTGGFDLLSIEKSEPRHLEFRVREKNSPTTAFGRLDVKDGNPAEMSTFAIRALPPGTTSADMKIDSAEQAHAIDGAIAALNEYYVFPDVAKKMEAALREHQQKKEYETITNGDAFAARLTDDLRAVSHDKHLGVNFSIRPIPQRSDAPPSADDQARMRAQLERGNCAFEKVERLQPNIGYLKFNGFSSPEVCGPTATAAMNFLGHVDALIIDLRENGGGDPAMVAYVSSYLFDKPTHLNDLYNRKEDSTSQFWTLPYVPGPSLAGKPVYLLTSSHTFSGAEEFTYNLKMLKRATVIGETTGGGAHPVSGHRIDDHFAIGVPFARAVNPISKTNWEGTGVEPDVKTPAADALEAAAKMATDALKTAQAKKQ
jgi:retinol-binding protein 3